MSRARTAILYLALFHVGTGLSLMTGRQGVDVPDEAIVDTLIPTTIRAIMWVGFGASAVLASLRSVNWGWVLLSVMPAQRLVGHVVSTFAWIYPGGYSGLSSAWIDVLLWTAFLLLIRHLAGWPDLTAATVEPHRR